MKLTMNINELPLVLISKILGYNSNINAFLVCKGWKELILPFDNNHGRLAFALLNMLSKGILERLIISAGPGIIEWNTEVENERIIHCSEVRINLASRGVDKEAAASWNSLLDRFIPERFVPFKQPPYRIVNTTDDSSRWIEWNLMARVLAFTSSKLESRHRRIDIVQRHYTATAKETLAMLFELDSWNLCEWLQRSPSRDKLVMGKGSRSEQVEIMLTGTDSNGVRRESGPAFLGYTSFRIYTEDALEVAVDPLFETVVQNCIRSVKRLKRKPSWKDNTMVKLKSCAKFFKSFIPSSSKPSLAST